MENLTIHLWMSWLNRIGIIFNFFAGFMLAPELIGIERLKRIRNKISIPLLSAKSFLDNWYSDVWRKTYPGDPYHHDSEKQEYMDACVYLPIGCAINGITLAALVLGIYISNLLFHRWYYGLMILLALPATALFIMIARIIYRLALRFYETLKNRVKKWTALRNVEPNETFFGFVEGLILIGLYLQLYSLVRFPVRLIIDITGVIQKYISLTLEKLSTSESLRTIVVTLGVILFIVGNFFQLIATF